jgi:hypothetical protein
VNGDTLRLNVFLGTATQPMVNINKIEFDIRYNDSIMRDSNMFFIRDTSYWFNDDDSMQVTKTDTISGTITINLSRLAPRSGFGKIGSLIIVIDDHLDGIIHYNSGQLYNFGFSFTRDDVRNSSSAKIPTCYTNDDYYFKMYGVGIDEPKQIKLNIYPNPAKEYFEIESSAIIKQYDLYDLVGHKIFSKQVLGYTHSVDQNISNLSKGIYILKVLSEKNQWVTQKLIIE